MQERKDLGQMNNFGKYNENYNTKFTAKKIQKGYKSRTKKNTSNNFHHKQIQKRRFKRQNYDKSPHYTTGDRLNHQERHQLEEDQYFSDSQIFEDDWDLEKNSGGSDKTSKIFTASMIDTELKTLQSKIDEKQQILQDNNMLQLAEECKNSPEKLYLIIQQLAKILDQKDDQIKQMEDKLTQQYFNYREK